MLELNFQLNLKRKLQVVVQHSQQQPERKLSIKLNNLLKL